MFGSLFRRAEATVDDAVGNIGNRIVIAVPFMMALGFAAASGTLMLDRKFGSEVGLLLVAIAFFIIGVIVALVVRARSLSVKPASAGHPELPPEPEPAASSFFDDEGVMAVISSAAPIVLPIALRVAQKNWPLILAGLAGIYMFSQSSSSGSAGTGGPSPSGR